MISRIVHTSALMLATLLVLGSTIWAQSIEVGALNPNVASSTHTLTITGKGTLGPILSGSDPLGLNGLSAGVTVMASESLSPTKHTATSATYTLPAGAVTLTVSGTNLPTTSPSKMIINLTSKADTVTLIMAWSSLGLTVTDTTYLKKGSWTTAVLKHPRVFKPSPQKLTAAKTVSGPGCKIKYIYGSTTVLGFSGTLSNNAAADALLPDDDLDQ